MSSASSARAGVLLVLIFSIGSASGQETVVDASCNTTTYFSLRCRPYPCILQKAVLCVMHGSDMRRDGMIGGWTV